MNFLSELVDDLKRDEGFRARVYKCPAGYLTVGYGINLETRGITREEAEDILINDIDAIERKLDQTFPWFSGLSGDCKRGLINMVFNLGFSGFCKFKNMIAAIENKRFEVAAAEALNSKWAKQVGDRAIRISRLIQNG